MELEDPIGVIFVFVCGYSIVICDEHNDTSVFRPPGCEVATLFLLPPPFSYDVDSQKKVKPDTFAIARNVCLQTSREEVSTKRSLFRAGKQRAYFSMLQQSFQPNICTGYQYIDHKS